ncbi:hypothetical protein [Novacetimonas hansenii]|uniref:hypothetical protein n=1 Tax=Novacetimonas hansenii TaxID=436 RepID=UPI0009D6AD78|nr:hypothetical protein [Novacetimonas hansenii]
MHNIAPRPDMDVHDAHGAHDGRIRLELHATAAPLPPPDAHTVLVRVGPVPHAMPPHAVRPATLTTDGQAADGQVADGWAAVEILPTPSPTAFGHGPGCGCCLGRGGIGTLLGALFRRRATGGITWFTRVVVIADAAFVPALRRDVTTDVVVRARYRVVDATDIENA